MTNDKDRVRVEKIDKAEARHMLDFVLREMIRLTQQSTSIPKMTIYAGKTRITQLELATRCLLFNIEKTDNKVTKIMDSPVIETVDPYYIKVAITDFS